MTRINRRFDQGCYGYQKQKNNISCGKLTTGKKMLEQETKQRYESIKMVSGVPQVQHWDQCYLTYSSMIY